MSDVLYWLNVLDRDCYSLQPYDYDLFRGDLHVNQNVLKLCQPIFTVLSFEHFPLHLSNMISLLLLLDHAYSFSLLCLQIYMVIDCY